MKHNKLLAAIFVLNTLWLTTGCSQKVVHSDFSPSTSATDAASLVVKPDFRAPVNPIGEIPSIVANSPNDSGLTVESLDTKPAEYNAQNQLGFSRDGRSSGPLLPVYFDFAQASLREDQLAKIENNAFFIKKQKIIRVRVEGNCDERGTDEYNMALGERRALSVKKYMAYLGVDEGRIETLSYGEEQPLVQGDGESVWALNRRGDFLIEN
ncbi:MAG: hypothetical protein A2511_08425 [Deltaproteobacteria bacterium RIFOXYD12_FULL_50_9]|nr:MAG: hypothetical protein A2511_08425 [Deltaproteobacteria bacterium RIFOXYD12_FULL_50_9]